MRLCGGGHFRTLCTIAHTLTRYTPSLIRLESTASTVATEMNKLFNTTISIDIIYTELI